MRIRLLVPLFALLFALACTAQPAPPTATPGSPLPSTPAPATPTPTAAPSATVEPSLSPSPSASPSATTTSPSPTLSLPPSPSPTLSPTAAPTPTATLDPAALAARLDRLLDAQRQRYGIPGLGAAVVTSALSWSGGSGFASLEPERPVDDDTPFVVGSITKTFITALVMDLAAEGRLSLDDPLADWLPRYTRHNSATLRQLLSHTAGIFNYFEHPEYNRRVFGEPDHRWTPDEILTEFAAAPYFPAGTGYHYSNTGFILLGLVAEEATGNPLHEELRTRYFEPLGLADTFLQATEPPPGRAAHGYLVGRNGARLITDGTDYRPTTSAATVAWAAGSIAASAADLAVWARTLYGGELIEDEYLGQMIDFAANPYAGQAYGLGTRTRLIHGQHVVGHTGSLRGYAAAMWHFPEHDITVVVLSNRGRIDANPIADAISAVVLGATGYLP